MKNSASVHASWISGASLLSALPDFGLAGFFAISWVAPYSFGSQILKRPELIMLMEFFILHSSAFLGAAMTTPRLRSTRILAVLGLGMFYTMFVGSIALSFGTWWPLVSFWMLLVNRMMAILLGPRPETGDFGFIVLGWAVGGGLLPGLRVSHRHRVDSKAGSHGGSPGGTTDSRRWSVGRPTVARDRIRNLLLRHDGDGEIVRRWRTAGHRAGPSLATAPRRGLV